MTKTRVVIIFDADGTLTPMRDGSVGKFEPRLLPGVAAMCRRLRQQGATLAIASNQSAQRPRREIVAQLRWTQTQIGATTVRWATTGRRRKPRPTMLLEIARQLGASPAECLFVGDRKSDEQAAHAAGMAFQYAGEFFS